jgi:hypothetical protein
MTSSQGLTVELLRELIRHLQAWHSLYEAEGTDVLTSPEGEEWSLWDIDILYEMSQYYLSARQRQAIRFCLYENLSEARAARAMGTDESIPVAMYASSGLETLVHLYRVGMLPSVKQFRREKAKADARTKVVVPAWTEWADVLADVIEETYVKKAVPVPVPVVVVEQDYYQAEQWADYLEAQYSNSSLNGGNGARPPT